MVGDGLESSGDVGGDHVAVLHRQRREPGQVDERDRGRRHRSRLQPSRADQRILDRIDDPSVERLLHLTFVQPADQLAADNSGLERGVLVWIGGVEGRAFARSARSALAAQFRSSGVVPGIQPAFRKPPACLPRQSRDPQVGVAARVGDVPDVEEATDDSFLVESEVLVGRGFGQPERREDAWESIAQRAQLHAQIGVGAAGAGIGRLEHTTDRLEPATELVDQPVDVVLGDARLEQRPDRPDDRLVARVEAPVRERLDLAHRHQPFDEGHRRAGCLGELGERHGAHAAMVRGRYAVEHGTGDRQETEANDLTDLVARPAIPPGLLIVGVVAIGRHVTPAAVPAVAEALAAGGVRALELTLNKPEDTALASIEAAAHLATDLGLEIGAGTVLTIEAATRAIDAGATFLVMPHLDEELVAWAARRGIPAFPGCATPTEILGAWRAGAAAVKLFPASSAGPGFVREMSGPFPEIPLVPTGGVTVETAPAFIAAGAVAVGMGGWLLGDGVAGGIRERATAVVAAVGQARHGASR